VFFWMAGINTKRAGKTKLRHIKEMADIIGIEL
jgi:hypothetical protein